jgi:hypothetical protein
VTNQYKEKAMKKQMIKTLRMLSAMSCCLSFSILAHHGTHEKQQQEQKNMIECQISMPQQVKLGESIPLTFKLTNVSDKALKILNWNTPFEGWFNRYLKVTKEGQRVNYQGPMVKRFRPEESDYSALAAGQSKQATVNLAEGYEMTTSGTYLLSYSGNLQDVKVSDGKDTAAKSQTHYFLQCNDLILVIE